MNLSRIYIISWFGATDNLRSKRKEYHQRQIEWAIEQGLDIFVLAQEYDAEDFHPDITYIKTESTKLLFPGSARDKCLEHFYKSNENFAIFADNDAILYKGKNYADSPNFIKIFNTIPLTALKDIDYINPIDPRRSPFRKELKRNEELYEHSLLFEKNIKAKGSFFILRNLDKFYRTPIYHDVKSFETEDRFIAGEDIDFAFNLVKQGFSSYVCKNIMLQEFANDKSTWVKNDNHRREALTEVRNLLIKKYGIKVNTLTYKNVGTSILNKKLTLKFANDVGQRTKSLLEHKHTDVKFWALPYPMKKKEVKEFLKTYPLYLEDAKFKEVVDSYNELTEVFTNYKIIWKTNIKPKKCIIPKERYSSDLFDFS